MDAAQQEDADLVAGNHHLRTVLERVGIAPPCDPGGIQPLDGIPCPVALRDIPEGLGVHQVVHPDHEGPGRAQSAAIRAADAHAVAGLRLIIKNRSRFQQIPGSCYES